MKTFVFRGCMNPMNLANSVSLEESSLKHSAFDVSEGKSEATPARRSASTDRRSSVSETSPSLVKDSSPAQVLPARHSSHTSSVKQQTATSPVQTTARSSVDSKQGDALYSLCSTCSVTYIVPLSIKGIKQCCDLSICLSIMSHASS